MGMRMNNIQMTIKVRTTDLLKKLRENLEQHSKIVAEARVGYVEKAKAALLAKLEELKKNKTTTLTFALSPPADYSEVYISTIKMLEWNTADEVELAADEFRQLVEDKWDWTYQFYATNAPYSGGATAFLGGMQAQWDK